MGLQVKADGLIVRAPIWMPDEEITVFLRKHRDWIEKHTAKVEQQKKKIETLPKLTQEDIRHLAEKARKIIPERVAFYAPKVGVTYGNITIRNQRTRWGSCSSKGNLNFNCLLMLTPPEVIDSVVVHELCHRKEMNHSEKFYEEVLRVYPDYLKWNQWLKENGAAILMRME